MVRHEVTDTGAKAPESWVEVASTLDDLQNLRPDWHALWACCHNVTPFQSPEWLIPWWTHLGQGTLFVLSYRVKGRLCGLAPFAIQAAGSPSTQVLVLLGTGVTDYLDILVEPGFEQAATAAFLNYIDSHSELCEFMDFQQLRPGSPLLDWEVHPDWQSELMVQEVCPVITLPRSIPELRFGPTGRMAEKLAYYRRRAAQEGVLVTGCATADNYEEYFHSFLHLHQARWEARGLPGALRDDVIQRFHWEASRALLQTGVLRLYVVRLGSHIIAALYALSCRERTFHYLSGFDPRYAPLSPGTLVIGHAVEEALRQGDREFDFLRGRETYKYIWGAKGRLNCRRLIHRHQTTQTPERRPRDQLHV